MIHQFADKKVVVTGGAGFIGSHLVDALVRVRARVTVLDNLSTGKIDNIAHHGQNITFVQGDIQDAALCARVVQGCVYVFHLAACVSVPQSFAQTDVCHHANVTGTYNLLEAARYAGVKAFIFSSSCAVYGERSEPCIETMDLQPTSPYAYSKWMGEIYCKQYAQLFDIPTFCLRYFNVIGPRQNPEGPYAGVVAKFRQNLEQNLPITIFGDGLQTRDFISVERVVQANLQAALLPRSLLQGQVSNCASGQQTTVLDLWHNLKAAYPAYIHEPQFKPARVGDIRHSSADCSRYKALFDC